MAADLFKPGIKTQSFLHHTDPAVPKSLWN